MERVPHGRQRLVVRRDNGDIGRTIVLNLSTAEELTFADYGRLIFDEKGWAGFHREGRPVVVLANVMQKHFIGDSEGNIFIQDMATKSSQYVDELGKKFEQRYCSVTMQSDEMETQTIRFKIYAKSHPFGGARLFVKLRDIQEPR